MKHIVAIILSITILSLSACGPEPGDSPPPTADPEDDPLIIEFNATCSPNDLANYNFCQNGTCLPADDTHAVSVTPLLEWESASCIPNGYKIQVFAFPNIKVFEGMAIFNSNTSLWDTSILVSSALDPGGHYVWSVTPILNGQDYWTPNLKTFFTGPICSGFGLLPPDLASPSDNATVSVSSPVLILSYAPDCNPLFFIRELDISPSFNGPNLTAGASGGPFLGQIPAAILQDCTKYYWRALAGSQGQTSPWSSTYSFNTDFNGACSGQPVQSAPEENQPMFNIDTFYYGGNCVPQELQVEIMLDLEDVFSVQLFYRLSDMMTGEYTQWMGYPMQLNVEDYYQFIVESNNIAGAGKYQSAYLQMQIVAFDDAGMELLRTEVYPDSVELVDCGGPTQTPKPTREFPTPTPRPSPTPRR